ncbi:MAG: penicillin acylase family protein [Chloroflexi bacterium]|nr:penicillin acylase family protein [Chloroflexota bacterium]MQC27298.1 penicillin acylase family protein [Chloroflexota bacterium]
MSKLLRWLLFGVIGLLLIVALVALIYVPRAARASFPQIDGQVQLAGLDGPVDIYRDSMGIPHIYGSSEHDIFLAQGYVHAQDRFWQMDFQRHAGSGRLSELLGSNTLDTDVFLRTMGWERVAGEELQNLDARTLTILEAYAEGVNAYLAEHTGVDAGLEYLFLNLLNRGYEPEAWTPLNTLTWAKAMAWDLKDNMETEIERAILLREFSPEQINDLYPSYPEDHPFIVPDFASQPVDGEAVFPQERLLTSSDLASLLDIATARFASLDALFGSTPEAGLGSNSWVVSGKLSASGAPLMANDPHLGASMPSIWYQNGLHCVPVGPNCRLDVTGVSFVGAPGVVIGHNQRIAWGFTNMGPDVMDLYVIKVNPDNPYQYEMNGEWVDMQILEEQIRVAGKENVALPVRVTQFGPIISDSYGPLEEFGELAGIQVPENYAVALRWTALEPSNILGAVLDFNFAQNWDEFREATRGFVVPSQNLIYADVDGNIGYQMPGNIPIRSAGDGRYPSPGWTDEYAWQGYIPFEELPFSLNPESGYIITANNAVVSTDYPYLIADSWDYGYRAQRILDLVQEIGSGFTVADYERMQADSVNLGAIKILPALMDLDMADDLADVRALLDGWNGQQTVDSAAAALFNAYWKQLLAATFHDDLPEDYWPGSSSRWYVVIANLQTQPQNTWWDDRATIDSVEERDDILGAAFAAAVNDLRNQLGDDPSAWAWGELHTITFEHQVMSSFPLIDRVFNRGPFSVSGGGSIVNATGWDPASDGYAVQSLPSKRTIMDLSNWQNSLQIHTTGQSGHPNHPHYIDMAPIWAEVGNIPMNWDFAAIQADAEGYLQLLPE